MRSSSSASLFLWGLGSLASAACAKQCTYGDHPQIIAHTGEPVGREEMYNGVNLYISEPECKNPKVAVLYLTDVFGIQLRENKLLADSFARAGFLVVAPDMFDGEPAPLDFNEPGFNATEFTLKHGPNATDPILDKGVAYLKERMGVDKIAATGYCFGGRYAFRLLADGKEGVDAAFAAHPSLLEDSEIEAITRPVSVAAAENDTTMSPDRRFQIETLLQETNQPYQLTLYSGTNHGFGVRANVSDPQQKFGKESAFYQAVRWFDAWAGGAL
ncbi:dienelactone hydrolase family-domain-containing protein [Corynascus novoguineensis]|uniref:Dienelactone hydrolase family-domain-containing protein n=1 Tax=Corynascus novoguineensis TaxID=1126955 RepID=A0AAN7HCD8_9PEZI|nr:dienelactone hydrolase family-domain-containing protein [Corynascus novoguineensis]